MSLSPQKGAYRPFCRVQRGVDPQTPVLYMSLLLLSFHGGKISVDHGHCFRDVGTLEPVGDAWIPGAVAEHLQETGVVPDLGLFRTSEKVGDHLLPGQRPGL